MGRGNEGSGKSEKSPAGADPGPPAKSSPTDTAPEESQQPQQPSLVCKIMKYAEDHHLALSFDLGAALYAGGALHVSLSPDRFNIFVGAGLGMGLEGGFTVGPAWERNTDSVVGFRTFATAGGGHIVGGAGTIQAGSNGVLVAGGVGIVEGAIAETGGGIDFNFPSTLKSDLCGE